MRGILVTPNNVYWYGTFRSAHIEGGGSLRKCCGGPRHRYWHPLMDRACPHKQQRTLSDNPMTDTAAPAREPVFIEVGQDAAARRIAVRARDGVAPGLFWLGGFNSDMKGTKALALDEWAAEHNGACVRFDYSCHGESRR